MVARRTKKIIFLYVCKTDQLANVKLQKTKNDAFCIIIELIFVNKAGKILIPLDSHRKREIVTADVRSLLQVILNYLNKWDTKSYFKPFLILKIIEIGDSINQKSIKPVVKSLPLK